MKRIPEEGAETLRAAAIFWLTVPLHCPTKGLEEPGARGNAVRTVGEPRRPGGWVECQLLEERSIVLALRPLET